MKRKFAALIFILGNVFCFGQDTVRGTIYYKIKDPFYKDKTGNLYYKYIFHDDDQKKYTRYASRMPLTNWEVYDSLKNFIDPLSYVRLGGYAKDKNHVYYFIYNSDGTTMRILDGADALAFTGYDVEGGWDFGRDKNFVYHNAGKVQGCSPKAILKFFKSPHCTCYDYFTDGKTVFYSNKPLKGADPKTFKTIEESDKEYDAEDKNKKYKNGKSIN